MTLTASFGESIVCPHPLSKALIHRKFLLKQQYRAQNMVFGKPEHKQFKSTLHGKCPVTELETGLWEHDILKIHGFHKTVM